MNTGTLFFFCGKMGAGKSTLAQKIAQEHKALLLSEDAWLAAHYPEQIQSLQDYVHYAALIKPFIKTLVSQALKNGISVVMDFPANTVKQRKWFMELSQELECPQQMYYLKRSDAQCLAQIQKRRQEKPERQAFDTEAMFYEVSQYFQAPTETGLNMIEVS